MIDTKAVYGVKATQKVSDNGLGYMKQNGQNFAQCLLKEMSKNASLKTGQVRDVNASLSDYTKVSDGLGSRLSKIT